MLVLAAIYTESIANGGDGYVSSEGSLAFPGQALLQGLPSKVVPGKFRAVILS